MPSREQQVLGFDVPMDDSLVMRVMEGIRHLPGEPERLVER
jgi:hypothetical protein